MSRKIKRLTTHKAASTIKRNLHDLRKLIDDPKSTPSEKRIAYAMETAIRWATEETVGWSDMASEAKLSAELLKGEL
jgi:O-succinylbenzoate synthase